MILFLVVGQLIMMSAFCACVNGLMKFVVGKIHFNVISLLMANGLYNIVKAVNF